MNLMYLGSAWILSIVITLLSFMICLEGVTKEKAYIIVLWEMRTKAYPVIRTPCLERCHHKHLSGKTDHFIPFFQRSLGCKINRFIYISFACGGIFRHLG